MTKDDLARIHSEAGWLISKRSGKKLLAAIGLPGADLEELIGEIADLYELSDADRAAIRPSRTIDTLKGGGAARDWVGAGQNAKNAAEAAHIIQAAHKTKSLARTGRAFISGGKKAAQSAAGLARASKSSVSAGAKVAGREQAAVFVAITAYDVISTGVFVQRALAYRAACHRLVAGCIEDGDDRSGSAGVKAKRMAATIKEEPEVAKVLPDGEQPSHGYVGFGG